jgi:hypothetical protein
MAFATGEDQLDDDIDKMKYSDGLDRETEKTRYSQLILLCSEKSVRPAGVWRSDNREQPWSLPW